jgi:hypothetical protein
MDFGYTNRFDKYPNERNVYHALYNCPDSDNIDADHWETGMPPPSEGREPCKECRKIAKKWLKSTKPT